MHNFRVGIIVCVLTLFVSLAGCGTSEKAREGDLQMTPDQCSASFEKGSKYYEQDEFIKAGREYRKFLDGCKSSGELYDMVLKRQFEIADAFLDGRKKRVLGLFDMSARVEGVKMMGRIRDHAGDSELAARAAVEVAWSYENRGKKKRSSYLDAYHAWLDAYESYDKQLRLSNLSPTGELGKDALLGMARCQELAYREEKFDVSDLSGRPVGENLYDGAKRSYEQFRQRYPEEAKKQGVDARLKEIDEKLAKKDLWTGQYYQKRGSISSANLYYQMVIRDWPGTGAAAEATAMLAANMAVK
jgi:tetratricopeptide (TPR) repeat protein